MRFQGKVLFATGGASGLGAATAQRFADEGAKVVVADIDGAAAEAFAASLPDALAVTVDCADAGSVQSAIASAVAHFGRVDVIFNNAGIEGVQQPLHEMDVGNWHKVTGVNGDGVFFVLRYGIEAMLPDGVAGSIVNTSSTAGLSREENISPYTFTKAGIVGLTRAAAVEYAARGIRVNAIAPTVVMTPAGRRSSRPGPGSGRDARAPGVLQPHARDPRSRGRRRAGGLPRLRRSTLDHRRDGPDRRRVHRR